MALLHFVKCFDAELIQNQTAHRKPQRRSSPKSRSVRTKNSNRVRSTPPNDLFSLIEWLSPAFQSIDDTFSSSKPTKYSNSEDIHISSSPPITASRHRRRGEFNVSMQFQSPRAPRIVYGIIRSNDSDDDGDDHKDESSHSNSTVILHDDDDDENDDDDLSLSFSHHNALQIPINIPSTTPSAWSIGVALSHELEVEMRKCRVAALLKGSTGNLFHRYFDHYGAGTPLLRDILSVIIEFELGFSDIAGFTLKLLHQEMVPKISCYFGYALGCYESMCTLIVVLFHTTRWWTDHGEDGNDGMRIFSESSSWSMMLEMKWILQGLVGSWCLALSAHIIGATIHWRRGCRITDRLRQLKMAMRVSRHRTLLQNQFRSDSHHHHHHHRRRLRHKNRRKMIRNGNRRNRQQMRRSDAFSDDNSDGEESEIENMSFDVDHHHHHHHKALADFDDIHIGEAFIRLQRWCNLATLRVNDKLKSTKMLMLVLQKYILPLSIALCLLIDPTGSEWYAYCSILAYYLHLHILYEIFHHDRHALVAFARVSLFWGVFISIVAAIASATGSRNAKEGGSDHHPSSEANFLAGLAGLLLFGIFIAVFDVCWFFSDNPAKRRLVFFVVLVNFCYIGGCFYMFNQSVIVITLLFAVSLVHCQIVFNQIVDCMLFGDVDDYLDQQIPEKFMVTAYYQAFCGMTDSNYVSHFTVTDDIDDS